jgi:hypothetical protein
MPKYVYDPKLNMMVPQQKRGIDYTLTGEGLRITDHDRRVKFVITRNNECRLPGRGMKFDCKLYDTHTARQIAERVQRIYPQSKYKDWRFFAKGFRDPYDYDIEEQMTSEDKALLRSLSESYGTEDVMNFVNHLDEGHSASVYNAQSSHGQTPGTSQHGLKGFVNALPSLIIGFLVCPPAMIMGWLGAVPEKRWLKTRINPNRWMDFVATPWERQKKVKDKIAEEMAANTNYYYTRLANGEILRVVGCSTLEAKEMIMAIEHKDIIPRYADWNKKLNLTQDENSVSIVPPSEENYKMWVIKFDNGEACYAFGKPDASDKEEIMESAIESRKAIVEYYKKIKYKDEDNGENKVQRHRGIGKEKKIFGGDDDAEMQKLFSIPKIDDMIELTNPSSYKIINDTNYKEFSEPQTSSLTWGPSGNVVYQFRIENIAVINLPLKTDEEANTFCKNITANTSSFANTVRKIVKDSVRGSCTYYKGYTANEDVYVVPVVTGEGKAGAVNNIKAYVDEFTSSVADAVMNNNLQNETPISELSIKDYRANYVKGNQLKQQSEAETPTDREGSINAYRADWSKHITYKKIDSRTKEILEGPTTFNEGTVDNEISAIYNAVANQNQINVKNAQQRPQANMTRETPDSSTTSAVS